MSDLDQIAKVGDVFDISKKYSMDHDQRNRPFVVVSVDNALMQSLVEYLDGERDFKCLCRGCMLDFEPVHESHHQKARRLMR